MQPQAGAAAGVSFKCARLDGAARAGLPPAGRAPRTVVLDNLRDDVLAPDYHDPGLNPLYRDLLNRYGALALPSRLLQPWGTLPGSLLRRPPAGAKRSPAANVAT
ncbi:MAG: hypothetical protein ACRD2E_05265 [Terriglobales bacterium]